MTVQELLNVDINDVNKFNETTLRKAVQTLSSAANKRIHNIQQAGIVSPAATAAEKNGKFTPRGKNRNQLMSEYVRAVNFLTSETSTVTGAKKYTEKVKKELHLPEDTSPEDIKAEQKNFWDTFNDLYNSANNLWTHSRKGSAPVIQMLKDVRDENPNASWEEIAEIAQKKIDNLYTEGSDNGTSGFFDFGEYEQK